VSRVKAFAAWARELDLRVLGPSGWLPDGTSYAGYQTALARGSESPAWVNIGRWLLILALFALLRWGGDGAAAAFLVIPIVGAFGVLTFRVDRDIRVAARKRAQGS
jgi:hypothetical protein